MLSFSEFLGACMRIKFTVKAGLLLNRYICMHACSFNFAKDLLSAVKNQNIFCLSIKISCHMIQCKAIIEKRDILFSKYFICFETLEWI